MGILHFSDTNRAQMFMDHFVSDTIHVYIIQESSDLGKVTQGSILY